MFYLTKKTYETALSLPISVQAKEICEKNLKILNTILNKEKVYDNYGILINNSLFLNTFAKDAIENRI